MSKLNQLSPGVARELNNAIARTGMTRALKKATERLPVILAMQPEQFERYMAQVKADKKRP